MQNASGSKSFDHTIRSRFPTNCRTEAQRQSFLDWFEAESRLVASRHSDSDDNVPDIDTTHP